MEPWLIALITILCCVTLPMVFLKLYILLTARWNYSPVCLVGKTAIVTGSNIGIGYYTALDFAKRGAKVILACRNAAKAEEAKLKIIEATGNNNVIVKIVDLSSLSSVRTFAKDVNETEDRLDILVNNAGAGCTDHCYTADGLSMSMQINHFGPFLLTMLLIDLLKKSAPSRIVTVSSSAASVGRINVNNLNAPSRIFTNMFDYANVKLCNLLFTVELAQKLVGTGVTANVLHPGMVKSDFLKDTPTFVTKLISIAMKLFYKSTEAGAQTSVYVAISKDLKGVSGKYFAECAYTTLPRLAEDRALAKVLWNKSEEFVKLTVDEKQNYPFTIK
ncbi:hypothetical protein RN001_011745 [Aquatica leii]|uniref:Uncharacterized protein n=1 Tax=Aquatica leii TaxID=1421715 RepID=A0AAN7SM56_9COLE|nr:hypothetical protein RN001_011745 [Aquatica leii]